ncbi:MAG: DeoR/GlpR family DNA-binding transcription regulator, partial [Granulicatella adiacens]
DLQQFEDQGVVERFYGGARFLTGKIKQENVEQIQYNSMKKNIARRAAGLVRDHNMVFINSGSTAFLLLNFLADANVTILTNNGRSIFKKPSTKASIVISGGEIFEQKKSLVGDFAINSFSKARADICFLGVGGISKNGISTYALPETAVNRVILERTTGHRIIVTEGFKVGRDSNFHTADCNMITHLITDHTADPETVAYLKSIGVKVIFIS